MIGALWLYKREGRIGQEKGQCASVRKVHRLSLKVMVRLPPAWLCSPPPCRFR